MISGLGVRSVSHRSRVPVFYYPNDIRKSDYIRLSENSPCARSSDIAGPIPHPNYNPHVLSSLHMSHM